jgi:hypothetical protein
MKKLFAFGIVILFATASFSQKIDETKVPASVLSTLKSKFMNATGVVWTQEDTIYAAEFMLDDSKTEMKIDKKGAWINTEWEMPVEYTTQGIKKYVDSVYTHSKIKEFAVMDLPGDGKVYVVEICKKKDCHKVYFSLTSQFKKAEPVVCDMKKKCCKNKKKDKPAPVDPTK